MSAKSALPRRGLPLAVLAVLPLLLTACLPGDGVNSAADPAGFFWGVWHGWLAPLSLVYGYFKPGIRIYETANSGLLYDLGFYMAVISGFGGLNLARGQRRSKG